MTSKKQLQLAYGLAIGLFIVGVVCYAYTAFSAKPLDQPIRLMYKVAAGNVLFDHQTHADESGYGLSCADCHHHPEEDEEANQACGNCHVIPSEAEPVPKTCLDCHEADEIEDAIPMKRSDAFHKQCGNCHAEIEAGPLEKECNSCHVR
ncbi:MAG: cytochrome c3 family protein [Deltaproteobacteria bacterium]|nr:MAG: cytochrome c3 family protein [Deltaproteobacteria bacterium]